MQPWYVFDYDVSDMVNPAWDRNTFLAESDQAGNPAAVWKVASEDMERFINKEWLDQYKDAIGISSVNMLVFYREPRLLFPLMHIDVMRSLEDGNIIRAPYGMNVVLDPNDDSEMIWYEDPGLESATRDITPSGNTYYGWPIGTSEVTYRHTIGNKLTLVDPGIPHNVETFERERWCFTLRNRIEDRVFASYGDALEYFCKRLGG